MTPERMATIIKAAERFSPTGNVTSRRCFYVEGSGYFCASSHLRGDEDYGHPFVPLTSLLREVADGANKAETCTCSEFVDGQQPGTDNEGYGRLIKREDGDWRIGVGLSSIDYCPWCGKRVPAKPEQRKEGK